MQITKTPGKRVDVYTAETSIGTVTVYAGNGWIEVADNGRLPREEYNALFAIVLNF